MLYTLTRPSISAIRVQLIQEKLNKHSLEATIPIRIAATGKTGSGKSTLGNRLIGIEYFLKSDGHQDCTDRVNVIRFPGGLEYVDLPGVSSDELFENYNRLALGLEQVTEWPQVDMLTIALHHNQQEDERKVSAALFPHNELQPDVIFYLVAPHQQLLNSDVAYMADLLKFYGSERIVFVFNLFTDKEKAVSNFATYQNIEDVMAKIKSAYEVVGMVDKTPNVVDINCWTGQGIDKLIASTRSILDESKGEFLKEVICYQRERTPDIYVQEVKKELIRFFAVVAFDKPDADSASSDLPNQHTESLSKFLSDVRGQKVLIAEHYRSVLSTLTRQIIQSCTQEITEPIIKSKSRRVYNEKPIYKETEETDYSKPIYREEPDYKTEYYWSDPKDVFELGEAIVNIFDRGQFGKRRSRRVISGYHKVLVGYETKIRVSIARYEKEYSHTEHWEEDTGRRRVVNTLYEPFDIKGITLLAAYISSAATGLISSSQEIEIEKTYTRILERLQNMVGSCQTLDEDKVVQLLEENMEKLFPTSFADFIKGSVEL